MPLRNSALLGGIKINVDNYMSDKQFARTTKGATSFGHRILKKASQKDYGDTNAESREDT